MNTIDIVWRPGNILGEPRSAARLTLTVALDGYAAVANYSSLSAESVAAWSLHRVREDARDGTVIEWAQTRSVGELVLADENKLRVIAARAEPLIGRVRAGYTLGSAPKWGAVLTDDAQAASDALATLIGSADWTLDGVTLRLAADWLGDEPIDRALRRRGFDPLALAADVARNQPGEIERAADQIEREAEAEGVILAGVEAELRARLERAAPRLAGGAA